MFHQRGNWEELRSALQTLARGAFQWRSARPFKGALLGILDKASFFVGHPRQLASLPPVPTVIPCDSDSPTLRTLFRELLLRTAFPVVPPTARDRVLPLAGNLS